MQWKQKERERAEIRGEHTGQRVKKNRFCEKSESETKD